MLPLCEKYRPQTIEDIILPEGYKQTFLSFVKDGNVPNHLLFYGNPGSGKTTTGKALVKSIKAEMMFINGSNERSIDTVRNKILPYTQLQNLDNKMRIILIDEFDNFATNADAVLALRPILEASYKNVRFICTANYVNKIPPALRSRFFEYEFKPVVKETALIWLKEKILDPENITIQPETLDKIYLNCNGDLRKVINNIQKSLVDNNIVFTDDEQLLNFQKIFKAKDLLSLKTFLQNNTIDYASLYKLLYEKSKTSDQIITIAEYMYKEHFSVDSQINFCSCICSLWNLG